MRNLDIRGPNNWHHPCLLRDLARIIVSINDRMEWIDQSIPEPGIALVVQVPTQALSKAKADRALQKLEDMVKAELGHVIGTIRLRNIPLGRNTVHSVKLSLNWSKTINRSTKGISP